MKILAFALLGGWLTLAAQQNLQKQIDTGHAAEALQQLDATPTAPHRDLLRGEALYALNRFPEADKALAATLAADPTDAAATELRGLTLYRLGRPAEAIPLLEKAHTWTPETKADPAYILALCYIDTLRFDDARRAFAEQYSFPPDSAAAHLLAARMLLRREYVNVAEAEGRKALAADPKLPGANMLLGEIALAHEHLDEALANFSAEAKLDPLNGNVYERMGDAESRKGDYNAAARSLQRAVLLAPNSTGPYILLGKVMLRRNDAVTAAGYLERAERMDNHNYMTHSLLGQAYRAMGRTADAQRETSISSQLQSDIAPHFDSGAAQAPGAIGKSSPGSNATAGNH
ncbi:tetratricopeptide repeat protein [Terriglobus aquaticus]|uniref:Tetratricopeptide repeat protein n=1 Tax=Terriglobus aquaticus TaxID=940139 RepID=A0ABW9KHK7_9BACT|nr:tetratricopeptide repeat protein [Terriglobus aquaticus]